MHICCINNYENIFYKLINIIKDSGLYDIVNEIRCHTLGYCNPELWNDPKIKLRASSTDISLYESFTINQLREDAIGEDFYCLYLHTKGVTRVGNIFVESWVNYMCYFDIYKYKICIDLLDTNDTVGVNLQDKAGEECHYAGNFWWSKSNYIRKLEICSNVNYNDPEFWLTKNKNGKYTSLWHSHCPHYQYTYPTEIYIDKPIIPYTFDYTK